jgi:hypothetical protein
MPSFPKGREVVSWLDPNCGDALRSKKKNPYHTHNNAPTIKREIWNKALQERQKKYLAQAQMLNLCFR